MSGVKPIVNSILDNDLYKFSMQAAAIRLYDDLNFKATFTNRGSTEFPDGFGDVLRAKVNATANMFLSKIEEEWLRECPHLDWLPRSYIDFLRGYRFDPREVTIQQDGGILKVDIEGPWYRAIMWEVPLLSAISELYYEMTNQTPDIDLMFKNLANKTKLFEDDGCRVTDFGTRRRASYFVQDNILQRIKNAHYEHVYVGTSNMHFAHKHNMTPTGTHAHEWYSAHQAMFGVNAATITALKAWMTVFKGRLGTALPDTYTTDVFLRDFDHLMARQFDGLRQDSGDPFEWCEKIIRHYKSLGIDPMDKLAIFSDSLNAEKACALSRAFREQIRIAFGIGTNLTNDCGLEPLNMVIKASAFEVKGRWVSVVKLSDTEGKHHGSEFDIKLAKDSLGI